MSERNRRLPIIPATAAGGRPSREALGLDDVPSPVFAPGMPLCPAGSSVVLDCSGSCVGVLESSEVVVGVACSSAPSRVRVPSSGFHTWTGCNDPEALDSVSGLVGGGRMAVGEGLIVGEGSRVVGEGSRVGGRARGGGFTTGGAGAFGGAFVEGVGVGGGMLVLGLVVGELVWGLAFSSSRFFPRQLPPPAPLRSGHPDSQPLPGRRRPSESQTRGRKRHHHGSLPSRCLFDKEGFSAWCCIF